MDKAAILLLNLGGPLRQEDVEPFLLNLFKDRDILQLGPAWLQPLLARLIVALRLGSAKKRYAQIGGGSPILRETAAQAAALRLLLQQRGRKEPLRIVFRYAPPRADKVLGSLSKQGIRRLLPVSLYPQACHATTGSAMAELQAAARRHHMELLPGILRYPEDAGFLESLVTPIRAALEEAPQATVVFCAHGLPMKQIQKGDPYEREIHSTLMALQSLLGPIPGGFRLAYQSRVGPMAWLGPSLGTVLSQLAGGDVIAVPISFVSEHLETLQELDIDHRKQAQALGIRSFRRIPTPGIHPAFLQSLATQITHALDSFCLEADPEGKAPGDPP